MTGQTERAARRDTIPDPTPDGDSHWSGAGPSLPLALEQRAGLELADLLASPVYYGLGVPRGDGAPVLLIPGFLGSDEYLQVLRGWLRRVGYRPHQSGIAFCAGSPFRLVSQVTRRAEAIAAEQGERLTLIGHSLGGLLGCALARRRPDLVAHVVTLGSPLCPDPRRASHPFVAALAHLLIRETTSERDLAAERVRERTLLTGRLPDDVRLSSIYTREDAVVRWDACLDGGPRTATYEVRGTHCGLAWNRQVYQLLGRLLQTV